MKERRPRTASLNVARASDVCAGSKVAAQKKKTPAVAYTNGAAAGAEWRLIYCARYCKDATLTRAV